MKESASTPRLKDDGTIISVSVDNVRVVPGTGEVECFESDATGVSLIHIPFAADSDCRPMPPPKNTTHIYERAKSDFEARRVPSASGELPREVPHHWSTHQQGISTWSLGQGGVRSTDKSAILKEIRAAAKSEDQNRFTELNTVYARFKRCFEQGYGWMN